MRLAIIVIAAALVASAVGAGVAVVLLQTDRTTSTTAQPAGASYLCQDALARRANAERVISAPPVYSDARSALASREGYENAVKLAQQQRADADTDVRRYC